MDGSVVRDVAALLAYDFSPFSTVVDVGGGPLLAYILFDLPTVVSGATAVDAAAPGCRGAGGGFFEPGPQVFSNTYSKSGSDEPRCRSCAVVAACSRRTEGFWYASTRYNAGPPTCSE